MCTNIVNLIDVSFDIAFESLRPKQDEVSLRLYDKLLELANADGNTQYLILGTCTGIILVINITISFIVINAIKNICNTFKLL